MTVLSVSKKILPVALGASLGYAYWYFFGCVNGCMITGNWLTSTGYGALVGAAWLLPARKTSPASAQPSSGDAGAVNENIRP